MVSPAPISGHPHTSVVRCAVGSVAEVRSHRSVSFMMKHTLLATHLRVGGGDRFQRRLSAYKGYSVRCRPVLPMQHYVNRCTHIQTQKRREK